MELIMLVERREPSGECQMYASKPEGSRPAGTKTQSKACGVPVPFEFNRTSKTFLLE